jgi:hypothetical protein
MKPKPNPITETLNFPNFPAKLPDLSLKTARFVLTLSGPQKTGLNLEF